MKDRRHDVVFRLEKLAFVTGAVAPASRRASVRFLPFQLAIDVQLDLLVQVPLPEVRRAVEEAYRDGSMLSVPLGEGTFGSRQLADVSDGLLAAYDASVNGRSFLEVGCGTGALLARLADLGARVQGCEVGPQAREAADRYGVPVIQEPFSAAIGGGPYDCIYSHAVFEHIVDVEVFLSDCRALLVPGGFFFAAVPNCDPMLQAGDAAMLTHEHFNYFTAASATRLLTRQGFTAVSASISPSSGELRFFGRAAGPNAVTLSPGQVTGADHELARRYAAAFHACREAVAELLRHAKKAGKSVGFYAGGYQYADLMKDTVTPRFFDGDAFLHGKAWLDGLPAIEPPWNLRTNPCDVVVIFPLNFLNVIREFLVAEVGVPTSTKILSVTELRNGRWDGGARVGASQTSTPPVR